VFLGSDRHGTTFQFTVETGLNEIGRTEDVSGDVSGDVITSFECDADRTGSDVITVNL
jgi:hypothetical protein